MQRPLAIGADVVMHSTTRYLSRHSDAMGGVVVVKDASRFGATLRSIQAPRPERYRRPSIRGWSCVAFARCRGGCVGTAKTRRSWRRSRRTRASGAVHYPGLLAIPSTPWRRHADIGLWRHDIGRRAGRARWCVCGGVRLTLFRAPPASAAPTASSNIAPQSKGRRRARPGAPAHLSRPRARRRSHRRLRSGTGRAQPAQHRFRNIVFTKARRTRR